MSSGKTTITTDETLKKETNDTTHQALCRAAEKAGEIKERFNQAIGGAEIKTGQPAIQPSSKPSNESKAQNLKDKAEEKKVQLEQEKRELQENFEKGKENVKRERAIAGDPTADVNITGLSLLDRAQLAADEVYRAAGEVPIATDHEGSFFETATVMASNTVDLVKQAAAKTTEQAVSAAAHVAEALEGLPRKVDLSEIEQKNAQAKVNDLKAEHQELEDQAEKKKLELKEEVISNRAAGKPVTEPQTVSLAEASSQTATGILKAVGQKVSETVNLVRGAVTGNDVTTTTTTTTTTPVTTDADLERAT